MSGGPPPPVEPRVAEALRLPNPPALSQQPMRFRLTVRSGA
jgi:hypothetical protein